MSKAAEKAYNAIRTQILDGVLPAGSRLKEEELASRIGVSRTPIREALRRLDSEQFVVFAPNQGTRVASLSESDIAEIFALRTLLEGYAAKQAAKKITDEECDRLAALQADIDQAVKETPADMDRLNRANEEFHQLLLSAAGGSRLTAMVSGLMQTPVRMRTFLVYTRADLERSLNHHREILDALRARDSAWARTAMQSHISAARNVYFEVLDAVAENGVRHAASDQGPHVRKTRQHG